MPVIHQERSSQAEQRLDRQECDLPTCGDWRPPSEVAELLPRLTNRQVKEIGKLGHTVRLPWRSFIGRLRPHGCLVLLATAPLSVVGRATTRLAAHGELSKLRLALSAR